MDKPDRARRSLRGLLLDTIRERNAERAQISRLLHDEVGQVLSAVGLHLDVLRLDIKDRAPEIVGRTSEIQRMLEGAVQQVRRLSYQLCPEPLERAGLSAALRHLTGRAQQLFSGALEVDCPNSLNLPAAASLALYRIAEQALDNAVRHSGASRIRVVLRAGPRRGALEIRDNGRGFDPARARRRPAGLGLPLMECYARDAGLDLRITSAPGRYTIVKIAFQPGGKPAHGD